MKAWYGIDENVSHREMSLVGNKIMQICGRMHHAALRADSQLYITRPLAGRTVSDLRHRDGSLQTIQGDATTVAYSPNMCTQTKACCTSSRGAEREVELLSTQDFSKQTLQGGACMESLHGWGLPRIHTQQTR